MPAPSLRPAPCERMCELLVQAKTEGTVGTVILLRAGDDFNEAWEAAWALMIEEKAYPHATVHRRQWRAALMAARREFRACYYGYETGFSRYKAALAEALDQSRPVDPFVLEGAAVA